jgi:hypothetical protein
VARGQSGGRRRAAEQGLTYIYEDAYSASSALLFYAIPNFPNHRIDAYVSSTWRRRIGGVLRSGWVSERLVRQTMLPRYDVFDLYAWARISDTIRAAGQFDRLSRPSTAFSVEIRRVDYSWALSTAGRAAVHSVAASMGGFSETVPGKW